MVAVLWFSTWLWGQTCSGYELWPGLASWTCDMYQGCLHFHPSCLSALPSCTEGRQSFEWHPFEAYQLVMLPNRPMPGSHSVPAGAFKLEIWKLLTIWVLTHRCGGWASWREACRKQAEALSPQNLPPPQISARKDKEVGGEIPSAGETDDTAMFYSGPFPPSILFSRLDLFFLEESSLLGWGKRRQETLSTWATPTLPESQVRVVFTGERGNESSCTENVGAENTKWLHLSFSEARQKRAFNQTTEVTEKTAKRQNRKHKCSPKGLALCANVTIKDK